MSPSPTPSLDTLKANAVAAKATFTTAQIATAAARTPWDAALVSCGITHAHRKPGVQPSTTPVVAPSPLPDFATLGAALTTAVIAENVANAAYITAKQALSAALAGT